MILDLEIPYLDELEIWTRLKDRQPPLPVVIHTFLPEYPTHLTVPLAAAFLEKKGDTDELKAVVAEVIGKHYPRQFGRVRKGHCNYGSQSKIEPVSERDSSRERPWSSSGRNVW